MKLELRQFLGDVSFKRFILKIVEFNEVNFKQETNSIWSGNVDNSQMDSYQINILLLDKLFERKRVLQLFNRIQIQNITQGKPKDFL